MTNHRSRVLGGPPRPRSSALGRATLVAAGLIGILSPGCAGDSGPTGNDGSIVPPSISALLVKDPGDLSRLEEGDVVTVSVEPVTSDGALVEGASRFVHFESSDPGVFAPAGAGGGSLNSAVEPARATFRATGPGRAELRVTYPCSPSDPDCTPAKSTTVPVTVRTVLASIAFDPQGPLQVREGSSWTVEVRLLDRLGDPVGRAEAEVEIAVEPVGIVSFERLSGPIDGLLSLELTGEATGQATLRLDHPRLPGPAELAVRIIPRVTTLLAFPHPLTLGVDEVAIVTVLTLGPGGLVVPGEHGVVVDSDDPSVASIEEISDVVPENGEILLRVRGEAEGETSLQLGYPGVDRVMVPVRVGAPPGGGATFDRIEGAYHMRGLLREDGCGGSPQTLDGPVGGFVSVETFFENRVPHIRLNNGLGIYEGEYDSASGAWEGEFETALADGGVSRRRHDGTWFIDGGMPTFRGTLALRQFGSDGTERCRTVYDVEYRKR